jgi:hypothetical protein
MKLRYALYPNPFSDDPEDCVARIVPAGKITFEQFKDRVANQNTTVSRSDAYAVLEDAMAMAINLVKDGYIVDIGLVILGLAVQGPFEGLMDLYDPARHKVVARPRANQRLRRATRSISGLERTLPREAAPHPRMFVDAGSGTRGDRVTPGGIAYLWGRRLQFDPADPAQGIFFVAEDYRATRVDMVIMNKPGQLFFQIPDLPAGRYRVEVRAILRHGRQLKVGKVDEWLTVEPSM